MNTNKKIVKSVLNKTPNVERFFQLSIAVLLYVFTLFLVFPTYIQKVNINQTTKPDSPSNTSPQVPWSTDPVPPESQNR